MFKDAADRELAEQDFQDWQEWLWEENLLELWEAAQVEAEKVNNEALAIVAAGEGEEAGIF